MLISVSCVLPRAYAITLFTLVIFCLCNSLLSECYSLVAVSNTKLTVKSLGRVFGSSLGRVCACCNTLRTTKQSNLKLKFFRFSIMLSGIMVSVIMLVFVLLSVVMFIVMLSFVVLSDAVLNGIMLSGVLLSAIMLNA